MLHHGTSTCWDEDSRTCGATLMWQVTDIAIDVVTDIDRQITDIAPWLRYIVNLLSLALLNRYLL